MKLLYVTPMWTALAEVLLGGSKTCKGMPAFFRPLHKLVENGHEITMLILETDPEQHRQPLCPEIDWLKKLQYRRYLQRWHYTGVRKPLSEAAAVWTSYRAAQDILKENRYDFVYGHDAVSEGAGLAASRHGIPFGLRRYGDFYYYYIERFSMFKAICSRPTNYWSYRRRKAFVVATNDGSRVDEVYRRINKTKDPYPLYFWRNGYEPLDPTLLKDVKTPDGFYLFYAARLVDWKRQDRAIQLLYEAKKLGIEIPLYLAGQKSDAVYFQGLLDLAEKLGVSGQVHYLGSISLAEVTAYSANALACLSFYDFDNFGNVFIEYMTNGGIVLSLDDGSLDEVIRSGENGFLVHDMAEGAQVVQQLFQSPEMRARAHAKALETAHDYFLTWDDRVLKEIRLIEDAVDQAAEKRKRT